MKPYFALVAIILATTLNLNPSFALAQEQHAAWPKEIQTDQGLVVVYQPQPQTLNGNELSGTAAFSITPSGKKDPMFGALFFTANLEIDRDQHIYFLRSAAITRIRFAVADSTIDLGKIKSGISASVPGWNFSGSSDQLITSLERADAKQSNTDFKNDAPVIFYRNKPAVLVLVDGEPKFQSVTGSEVQRLVNTPFIIFKYGNDKPYYLYGGDQWMNSNAVKTGWTATKNVPAAVKKAMEKNNQPTDTTNQISKTDDGVIPEILVSTVPAELIQTKGSPNFVPIVGTGLLFADNTDDYIFKHIDNQKNFILKSGRWYTSANMEGPWLFVSPDSLPTDFAKIPPGSDADAVLASVPGTPQAKDAVLDAQVPQTATVDRKTAGKNVTVTFDGEPKFEPIKGTSLYLADNSSKTVLRSGSIYYLIDNGIWFEGKSANGPWEVSTSRPADVDKIPASSSAYNTKYVYIYDHTPDVVYVGYTPGYMGAYVYGPTVVYGTGWYYSPWYGTTYYARPCSWGFGMHYSPWTGWSMSIGYTAGPWSFGFGGPAYAYGGGWFGPPMYYPHYYYPPRYYGPSRGYYGPRPNTMAGRPGGYANNYSGPRQNIYNRPGGISGVTSGMPRRDGSGNNGGRAGGLNPSNRPNNVYSDKAGNVFKNENGGWQQHNGGQWENSKPSSIKGAGGMMNEPANRDRATQRFNGFQENRGSFSGGGVSRPGGMGGGGRGLPRR